MDNKIIPFRRRLRIGIHTPIPFHSIREGNGFAYTLIEGNEKILVARVLKSSIPSDIQDYKWINKLVKELSVVFNKITFSLKEESCTVRISVPFSLEEPSSTLHMLYLVGIFTAVGIHVRAPFNQCPIMTHE